MSCPLFNKYLHLSSTRLRCSMQSPSHLHHCSFHGAEAPVLLLINCRGPAAAPMRSRARLYYMLESHRHVNAVVGPQASTGESPAAPTGRRLQIQLPAIDCRFQRKLHSQYEAVKEVMDSWTLSLLDPPLGSQDPRYLAYLQGLYPLFTCIIYPSSPSLRRLALFGKLCVWFFLFDDILESHPDPDFAAAVKLCITSLFARGSPLTDQLKTKQVASEGHPSASPPSRVEAEAVRLVQRFLEVWEEMCKDMSPSFRGRVTDGLLNCVIGMWENVERLKSASNTHNDQTVGSHHLSASDQNEFQVASFTSRDEPSFERFMDMRVGDGFAKPMLDLMEYTLEIDLQNIAGEGNADLLVKLEAFKRSALWQMLWFNDIISVRKELRNGSWRLSTIGYLLKRRGIDSMGECQESAEQLQEVIMELWGMMKEEERVVEGLLEEIKDAVGSNPGEHTDVVKFCEEVCHSIAGNMYWTTLSARYNGLHSLPWNTPLSVDITSPNLDFLSV